MTTAETQHARPGRVGEAWRGFRRWRRSRPFWGGLFTALAGLEIFGTTQMSLNGLTFQMGPTGFLSWLIPVILVACGMLLWFTPAQRMFYAIVAAITALYSMIGVNLGGFFIGLLLGMIGSALGFAWVPAKKPAPAGEPVAETGPTDDADGPAAEDEPALVDELLPRQREDETTGVLTDTLPEPRNPLREPAPPEAADTTQVLPAVGPDAPEGSGRRDPKLYAILLVLASVSVAGLVALRGEQPALAAPSACPTTTATATADPKPSASASASASASPSPTPEATSDGNLLTDIVDGITGLFTGDDSASAEPSPTPSGSASPAAEPNQAASTPTPSATSAAPSTSSAAKPATKPGGSTCAEPRPTKPTPVEAGKPLPRVAAEAGQPNIADPVSKLTGSKVTMTGLRFDGIVELPTRDGTLKCLKFSMDEAVTDDFVLQATGPAGKHQRYVTDQLTVRGDVAFYATRFVGYLLGIKITLTPDLPFPDGIPITSPLPITFTDPSIDLAYVDSNVLTAKPKLKLDLV
ncbi:MULTISPECIES: DUF6114 domain-containing protein [Micromonospora]|uniref:Uncharacterized protein n=1 Tax=Micromonospora solifontis TaxID=2487138 RepID=A0ABX9WAY6_9ACTN|nr:MULTISPECIES: DUF6114 domain-containing protein [Micromonospora]NES16449.1 hypothetical protein [Micromonospora sp. PPF5-17B]NES39622.1 hypothetical protein [Micromonospora solifontis]NES58137.1 hypothetical protein [Micromonospora sp. PPF5-6]RNL87910.1 hypothetical protein EFE23_26435 [Micromonospora solifontis]